MCRSPTQGGISFDRAAGDYDTQRERLWEAEATAEALGRSVAHREELAWPMPTAPGDDVQRLEQRVWSWTWDVPEQTWTEVVEPALAAPRPPRPRPAARQRPPSRAAGVRQPGSGCGRRVRGLRVPAPGLSRGSCARGG
jgi:hypothetical protein